MNDYHHLSRIEIVDIVEQFEAAATATANTTKAQEEPVCV